MTPSWTLNAQPAALLGVSGIRRQRRTLQEDVLTFDAPARTIDAAPLFAYGTSVTVAYGTTIFFVGRVTQVPVSGTGPAEKHSYTLSGPWWDFKHRAACQQWNARDSAGAAVEPPPYTTRLILGQALDGTRLTTGQTITELLEYAIDAGAQFQIGVVDPSLYAPLDEVKNVTIDEAMTHVMRWHPQCVSWFDYTTSPLPTLHIRQRDNLTAKTFTLGVRPLSAVDRLTARHDLQVPAVVIHYEVTGSNNGQPSFRVVRDAFPTDATGRELNVLPVTIPLRGISATTVEQRVQTRGIVDSLTESGPNDARAWLASRVAAIQADIDDPAITADGVTITKLSRTLADPNAARCDLPAQVDVFQSALDRELVAGSITDWMIHQYAIRCQVQRFSFEWTANSGNGTDPSKVQTRKGALELTVTNAGSADDALSRTDVETSSLYRTLTSYDPGDTVPTGLAATLYGECNALQYSGSITLVEQEASGAAGIGNTLNLAAGAAEWATMAALITSESVDVDTGTTQLTFGPAEHLSVADYAELLKIGTPLAGRTDGSPSALSTATSDLRRS